jgi:hypothetical protein
MAGIWVMVGLMTILAVIITAGGRWERARESRGVRDASAAADPGYPGGHDDSGLCADSGAGDACGDAGGADGGGDGGGGD